MRRELKGLEASDDPMADLQRLTAEEFAQPVIKPIEKEVDANPEAEYNSNVTLQRYNEVPTEETLDSSNEYSNEAPLDPPTEATGVKWFKPTTERPKKRTMKQPTVIPNEPTNDTSPEPMNERTKRYEAAMQKTDGVAVVTVRAPERLNQYMDDYVARINKVNGNKSYRKQDAIAEAFAAFYADHPMPPAPVSDGEL